MKRVLSRLLLLLGVLSGSVSGETLTVATAANFTGPANALAQHFSADKAFTITDVQNADEAFVTSATTFVTPVVKINDKKISGGAPGKFTKMLRERYIQKARETAV